MNTRNKTYWQKGSQSTDIFGASRSVRERVSEASKRASTRFGGREGVEYLWIHLACKPDEEPSGHNLELAEWLNVVDEAATLGTTWVVVYTGPCMDDYEHLWELCEWAQQTHDMSVALHFTGDKLYPRHIEALNQLEPKRTYLFVEETNVDAIRAQEGVAVTIVAATIPEQARASHCTSPTNIACVHADGTMYCCGLVVGNEEYAMGDAQARPLVDVVEDDSLPHAVEGTEKYPLHGCDGCPSHLSHIAFEQLERHLND